MKVLVIGATGGSGLSAVKNLLKRGHDVTAMTRGAPHALPAHPRLAIVKGDATDDQAVARAVANHDAVVVTLGIRENPIRVRLFGAANTATDVRSRGTRAVIRAMRAAGVRKLVVQTSYGVGATRDKLTLLDKIFFAIFIKGQIADTEVQEAEVTESGLDWVLVQPVHLTDDDVDDAPFASLRGERETSKISRASVGRFLADAVESPRFVRQSVALSAPRAGTAPETRPAV
ncbi:MAG: NAD(P)H-binding protein [Polyangiales bacterium]